MVRAACDILESARVKQIFSVASKQCLLVMLASSLEMQSGSKRNTSQLSRVFSVARPVVGFFGLGR